MLKWFEQQHNECGHALANMFVERVKVQCAVSVCALSAAAEAGDLLECVFYNELR